jgi:sugar phosphate isomerase/epimerase
LKNAFVKNVFLINFFNTLFSNSNNNTMTKIFGSRKWFFAATAAFIVLIVSMNAVFAQQKIEKKTKSPIILSLNAYSFNDLLLAKDKRDNQTLFSMFNLIDWCASKNIAAVDLTGYYFPGYPAVPSDEFILQIKNKAAASGVAISGTGIRNNFASPDPAVRAADVETAKKWIEVAAKLGAPVVRLFAGEVPKGYENKWDEAAAWMIECYKECAAHAEKYGVKIGIQNHGDMLQTADQCIKVMKAVNSKWAGLIVDTGNFKTEDPYTDIEAVVPYAVNWQVKESAFGIGNPVRTDFDRLMKILKKKDYKGYLPVETILVRGIPYDPFALVPELLNDLQMAINANFK